MSHPRLFLRGQTFYFKAKYPADIADRFRSDTRWTSLKTKDRKKALAKCKALDVAFDAEMDARRNQPSSALHVPPTRLTPEKTRLLLDNYLTDLLEEDDRRRARAFVDRERESVRAGISKQLATIARETGLAYVEQSAGDSFTEAEETTAGLRAQARHDLARGQTARYAYEAWDLLARHQVRLDEGSEDYHPFMYEFLRTYVRALDLIEARHGGDPAETPARPSPSSSSGTLGQMIDAYMADPSATRSAGTIKTYRTVFAVIREVIGKDRPAASITRQDCHAVRETLQRMPKNAQQRFRGMTLKDAITKAEKIGAVSLSPGTVNSYLENLSSLFKWGVKEWELPRNPAEGLSVADPVADSERRQPFSTADLASIFAAPLYSGCQNDLNGYAVVGSNRPRRGRFWIPLLALFHGLRQGEACQLHVNDVRDEGGVPCIHLTEVNPNDMDDADRKRIKTAAGVRYVPVHPEVIQCGFLEFVEEMRKGGHTRLFPEIVRGGDGYFSPYSKWFGRFLTTVGVKRKRVSFHSFRHSYRDAARRALLPRDVVMAIGGWAGKDTDDDYGDAQNALGPKVLAEHMAKMSYPGLELRHLHN